MDSLNDSQLNVRVADSLVVPSDSSLVNQLAIFGSGFDVFTPPNPFCKFLRSVGYCSFPTAGEAGYGAGSINLARDQQTILDIELYSLRVRLGLVQLTA